MSNFLDGLHKLTSRIGRPFRTASFSRTGEKPSTDKLYDLAFLEELEDNGHILYMLDTFLKNIPIQLSDIRQANILKDFEKVYASSHKLKGSAGMLQSPRLLASLQNIERLSRAGEDSAQEIAEAFAAYAKIEQPLRAQKEKLESTKINP